MKQTKRILRIGVARLPDEYPDTSYLDQEGFEDRKRAYDEGDFEFIGIRACADVSVNGVAQSLYSGGLWGIESDSGDDYLKEVEQEEMADLRQVLYDCGFSKRAISAAVNNR